MESKINTRVFTKKNICEDVSTRVRERGGTRKAIVLAVIFIGGICALIFATEDTMRNTYGRSIVHVKSIIFLCLAVLAAYGIRDYLNFHKKNED